MTPSSKSPIVSLDITNYRDLNYEIAQLEERQTEDRKIPGSNPKNSYEF